MLPARFVFWPATLAALLLTATHPAAARSVPHSTPAWTAARHSAPPRTAAPQTSRARTSGARTQTAQTPGGQTSSGEWLTDDEGRQYRLEPLPKAQGQKVDEQRVRTIWGVQADLAKEDDQFFYIKIYKVGPPPPPTVTPRPPRAGAARPGQSSPPIVPPAASAKAAAARAAAEPPLPRASQRLRWTDMSTGLPNGGQWREGLVLTDLTGDGRLDIVLSPARKSLRGPAIFTFDGKAWTRAARIKLPQAPYDYGDVAVGDVTNDGRADLLFGVHLKGLMELTGDADGAFTLATGGLPFSKGANDPTFSTRAILLADCNGDTRPELIALGEGPRLPGPGADPSKGSVAMGLTTFLRDENGTWRGQPARADGLFGSSIANGDVDGDGALDIVVAPGTLDDRRLVLRGNGSCGWEAETVDAARARSYHSAVAAADVNGDGRSEVVAGYTEFAGDEPFYGLDLLARGADGQWTRRPLARAQGRGRYEAIAIGDIDADGANDIAAVDGVGTVRLFLGDGRGGFSAERTTIASAGGCQGAAIAIGDLDRDGLADIVVSHAQEQSSAAPAACPSEGGVWAWRTLRATPAAKGTTSKAPSGKPGGGR